MFEVLQLDSSRRRCTLLVYADTSHRRSTPLTRPVTCDQHRARSPPRADLSTSHLPVPQHIRWWKTSLSINIMNLRASAGWRCCSLSGWRNHNCKTPTINVPTDILQKLTRQLKTFTLTLQNEASGKTCSFTVCTPSRHSWGRPGFLLTPNPP